MQPALPLVKPVEPRTLGVAAIILSGAMLSTMTQQFRDSSFLVSSAIITRDEVDNNSYISDNIPESSEELIPTKSLLNQELQNKNTGEIIISKDNEIKQVTDTVDTIKNTELNTTNNVNINSHTSEINTAENVSSDIEEGTIANKISDGSSIQDNATDLKKNIINYALTWEGVLYRWGGESRNGIDCSALVQNVYKKFGISLPRTSREQFRQGVGIPKDKLTPGDLVFFSTNGPGASHVGIYLGEGNFLSATRRQVEIKSLDDPYWQKYYRGSKRILD